MKIVAVWIVVLLVISVGVGEAKSKAGAEVSFSYMDTERTYFLFEPEGLGESPPVLILLHGSGRRGDSLIKPWKKLAQEEKILLVAPNSADPMV
jgi:poly(3-hydroxybutyrate) depolymerase